MPPRIPASLLAPIQHNSSLCTPSSIRYFSASDCTRATFQSQSERRRRKDPYALAQARARKQANLSRQEVLQQERSKVVSDPIRGETTAFVQSFDTGVSSSSTRRSNAVNAGKISSSSPQNTNDDQLNFFLSTSEFTEAIDRSRKMTSPLSLSEALAKVDKGIVEDTPPTTDGGSDGTQNNDTLFGLNASQLFGRTAGPAERARQIRTEQATAEEAMRRIASMSISNSKARLRLNTQRIIDTFGRHNTDTNLPPPLKSIHVTNTTEKTPRVGPDTGSSEVQIGILTAKIRSLADYLDTRGKKDKMNKRNLRLLVHRRAKLLKYLRRKERGGPRWQNLVDTLGLTDSTWEGEISL